MTKEQIVTVEVQCTPCRGSGVVRRYGDEILDLGDICTHCKGSGKAELKYIPFTGRVVRSDVYWVTNTGGDPLIGHLADGEMITYNDFLAGKVPPKIGISSNQTV